MNESTHSRRSRFLIPRDEFLGKQNFDDYGEISSDEVGKVVLFITISIN